MLLKDKVQKILIKTGNIDFAYSPRLVQQITDNFYNHFKSDIINHTPIRIFIEQEAERLSRNRSKIESV